MTWKTTEEAAASLNLSARTVRRRAKQGAYPSQYERGRLLVDVPDPDDRADVPVRPQPTPASTVLTERPRDTADALAAIVADVVRRADADVRHARRLSGLATGVMLMMLVGMAAGAVFHHRSVVANIVAVGGLQHALDTARTDLDTAREALEGMTAQRDRAAALVGF